MQKYYITVEQKNYNALSFSGDVTSQYTHIATEAELPKTLKMLGENKHRVVRIVKGEEIAFEQSIRLVNHVVDEKEDDLSDLFTDDNDEKLDAKLEELDGPTATGDTGN